MANPTTPSPDESLLALVTASMPTTIDDVLTLLQRMDDLFPNTDGLKWFNLLYLLVTKEIHDESRTEEFGDPSWVTRLDIVFATMYFKAVANFLSQSSAVPRSWAALFDARYRTDIERIQFALAGVNAHVNHDLALALLQTDEELHLIPSADSPEHRDYQRLNMLFAAVLPKALEFLATGILGELAQDTGKIGRLLAIWDVRVARDMAWDFANHLRPLSGPVRQIALTMQDRLTGTIGRTLLLPIQ